MVSISVKAPFSFKLEVKESIVSKVSPNVYYNELPCSEVLIQDFPCPRYINKTNVKSYECVIVLFFGCCVFVQ